MDTEVEIAIGRSSRNDNAPPYYVRIIDYRSGSGIIEAALTATQYAELLTGRPSVAPAQIWDKASARWGKRREHKSVQLQATNQDELTAALVAISKSDAGWIYALEERFNHHRRGNGNDYQVSAARYVPVEKEEAHD